MKISTIATLSIIFAASSCAVATESDDLPELDSAELAWENGHHWEKDTNGDKVTICHIPPGNPANAHTIEVGEPAVDAHLDHGDKLGPCKKKNKKYGDGYGDGKVTICHIPPGNPANAHTIEVGEPAVDAHLDHGDKLGPCKKKNEKYPKPYQRY